MKQPIHPEDLLKEAEDVIENGGWILADYSATIYRLKSAGWPYRKIAEWLNNKGIKCTHNQVYYVLKSNADDEMEEMQLDKALEAEDIAAKADDYLYPDSH